MMGCFCEVKRMGRDTPNTLRSKVSAANANPADSSVPLVAPAVGCSGATAITEIPLERAITDAILRALRAKEGVWCFKVLGGGGQMRGVPDIIGCCRGRFFALEVKRPKLGRLSAIQAKRIADIDAAGGIARVVCSVEEAIDAIGGDAD